MKATPCSTLALATVAAVVLLAGAAPRAALRAQTLEEIDPETRAALAEVREATAKYEDIDVALAEGYVRDPGNLCVMAPVEGLPAELGGMGVHFARPDLLGLTTRQPRVNGTGTHTDFRQPAVLVYVPDEAGRMKLAAVENLVFADAWSAAGHEGQPEFHGHPWIHRIDDPATPEVDEAHAFEPHYELHVWLYKTNPAGVFAQYNPNVNCNHHDGPRTMAESMEYTRTHGAAEPQN